ncbi:MAG: hypothetical protein ABFC57_06265 [Veillonellales bacterium]
MIDTAKARVLIEGIRSLAVFLTETECSAIIAVLARAVQRMEAESKNVQKN